ncbi:MAG: type II secretion system F family protein [Lachnospiraceae bacterium]|nr:type II secretion system F family protein [Lachnospiraceae bacterium]
MTREKIVRFMVIFIILGGILQGVSFYKNRIGIKSISRPGDDEEIEVTMEVEGDGYKDEITFPLSGKSPSEKEIEKLLQSAKKECYEEFLGNNKDYESISSQVVLKEEYGEGFVTAQWDFEPEDIIKRDGSINYDAIEEDTLVTCNVTFLAYDKSLLYSFPVMVKKPNINTTEGFHYFLEKALKDADENNKERKEITLPESVEKVGLKWREPVAYTGLQICFMGLFGGVILMAALKFDDRKKLEKERNSYLLDYPDIISALVLYVGAGMSVQNAFLRIGTSYEKEKKKTKKIRPAYERMLEMNRGIRDGKDFQKMLEVFGSVCCDPAYKKLSLLLSQNIRKGNEYLLEQLEKEEKNIYGAQQRRIKAAGEVASTKLLIPLGGLLIMVMIILVVPALATIQI